MSQYDALFNEIETESNEIRIFNKLTNDRTIERMDIINGMKKSLMKQKETR